MLNLKTNFHKFIYPIIIFAAVLLVDQLTKYFANTIGNRSATHFHLVGNFIVFNLVHNTGAAFSSVTGHQVVLDTMAIIITLISLWAAIYLLSSWFTFGLLLMGAGALSNCVERIATNSVTDFIEVNLFGWTFPGIFNIADSCVCIGAALVIVGVLLFNNQEVIYDNHDKYVFTETAEQRVINKIVKLEHDQKHGVQKINKIIDKTEENLIKHRKQFNKAKDELAELESDDK